MILAVILIPVITGIALFMIPFRKRWHMEVFAESLVLGNSALVWYLLLHHQDSIFTLARFTGDLSISFRVDGMSMVFAGLVSALWPLATLYAFTYMTKESHEKIFFLFYTATYGVTLGIAFAADLMTMYCFYELLTLVTVPLVMHTLTREAILASRTYLYYSLGGAAFAFVGLIFVIVYGGTADFMLGGVLDLSRIGERTNILLLVYVMAFLGFGVKAAVCPFNAWLPKASVAPTPVTALLHAVAVVKAGAFAIIRLTYYSFGADFVRDTWAQKLLLVMVLFTVVYGCSRAVKETHIKRRLAYSTISNLSYILFGVLLLTPMGMTGALTHLVFHAVIKICAFFCVGAILHQTKKQYVHELNGMGYRMPVVFGCFTASALALMGVPGLAGFVSKWNLAAAAVENGGILAYAGIGCLLVSALLTAVYMLTIVVRAFFPDKTPAGSAPDGSGRGNCDPDWKMLLPLCVFVLFMVYFGLHSAPVTAFFGKVAAGVY
ncbi:MAG: hypothetical protein NC399_07130 [Muribaculum sp.]|nr:hypothetical protein [Muribaculum sp.]